MPKRTRRVQLFHRFDGPEKAPVLVLSNSLGTNHAMWDGQVAAFARAFRVLRYDTRGHGASEVTPGPYDVALLAGDLLGLLDDLGLARVSLCGLSIGGMTATWIAAHAPERIERLVLCSTSALMGGVDAWNARIDAVRRDGMTAVTETVLERWFTAGFRAARPQAVERVRRMLLTTPATGYAACCAAVRDMDHRALLARIATPTLVVAGTHDPATPLAHSQVIVGGIPGARLVELDAAHLSNIETESAFNAAVLEFLSSGGESDG
jgi:3-oxoadipate enol-lactonase